VEDSERVSYESLLASVQCVATALARLGAGSGAVVAYFGPPGIQYLVSLLAAFEVGATWMGLNPRYRARELSYVIGNAKPSIVLAAATVDDAARVELASAISAVDVKPRIAQLTPGLTGMIEQVDLMSRQAGQSMAFSAEIRDCRAAVLVYTSGSTGRPKGACLTHDNLMENAWWLAKRIDDCGGRFLVNLPVNHVGCIADTTMVVLVLGGTQVFMRQFDSVAAAELVKAEQITTIGQIPTQFQMMHAAGVLNRDYFSTVKHLAWGGAAMPATLIRELKTFVPDLFNSYGLTESTGTVTITAPGASVEQLAESVGLPVVEDAIRLMGSDGALVERDAVDAEGEIQVVGAHVFERYLNDPDATSTSFTADGWLCTGDVACWRSDGSLKLVGRRTEMFKSGGYNIYPREIEAVLESHPAVEMAAVIGVPDPLWGESGAAYVKTEPGAVTADELSTWCRERLAGYKVPKCFVLNSDLPLLPIGKIDRSRLKASHMQQ